MAVANRFRDTIDRNDPSAIFRGNQSLGNFLNNCASTLRNDNNVLRLSDTTGAEIRLANRNNWNDFMDRFFRSTRRRETDRARCENLAATLGISFTNFIRFIDDLCANNVQGEEYDATRSSALADLLHLYDVGDSYIAGVANGTSAPVSAIVGADTMTVQAATVIGADIMAGGQLPIEGRDRQEVEAQFDFEVTRGRDSRRFRNNAGNNIWHGLALGRRDLRARIWNDQDRVDLIMAYNMPLHLEINPNNATGFQLNTSVFLEVYLDTEQRALATNNLSLRCRVRPDQGNRALLQMKEELKPDPNTGRPVREKWERRNWGQRRPNLEGLVNIAQSGRYQGDVLASVQKLYQKLVDKNALPANAELSLRPDHIIFQRRTRTHLQLDSIDNVSDRLRRLRRRAARRNPVPANLQMLITKVENQIRIMEAAEDAMRRTIGRGLPADFDAVIISFDRWSAFEPSAYSTGNWPERLGDSGRRGRGLRVETELDAFTSEPFENAIEQLNAQLQDNPRNRAQLEADLDALTTMQTDLFADVATTARLMAEQMENNAGLNTIANPPASKSEAATNLIAAGQGGFRYGHRFWV